MDLFYAVFLVGFVCSFVCFGGFFLAMLHGMRKFRVRGLKLCHSSSLVHCSDSTGSLIHGATRQLPYVAF